MRGHDCPPRLRAVLAVSDPIIPDVPWRIEDVFPMLSRWPEAAIESMDMPEVPWWTPEPEEEDDIQ